MLLKDLKEEVKGLVEDLVESKAEVKVELHSLSSGKGTLAVPCHAFASNLKKSPEEVAEELTERTGKLPKLIQRVESKSGFLNFYLDEEEYGKRILEAVLEEREEYGEVEATKVAIMDEVAPNLAKPMHIGHLRNLVLSYSLNSVLEKGGWSLITDTHLGDWGLQYGNLIYAFKKWGDEEKFREEPIEHLLDLYQKFGKKESGLSGQEKERWRDKGRKEFEKLEKGDEEAVELWEKMKDVSVERFKETFSVFGMEFDEWIGESFYVMEGTTDEILEEALEKDIAVEKGDGSVVIPLGEEDPESGEQAEFVILKSDGSTVYGTRDLATIKYRSEKWDPEKIIYVVASEQNQYFRDLFKAAGKLGYDADKLKHVSYGMVSLPEGSMSTRRGRIIRAREVLEEVRDEAYEVVAKNREDLEESQLQKVAEKVAHAAIRYGMLRYSREKDMKFDKDRATRFEGETGPYLQYSLTRACSILEKEPLDDEPESLVLGEEEKNLLDKMARYPLALEEALGKYDPHPVAKYGFELAEEFNNFYHDCPVIQADEEDVKKSRKVVLKAFIEVMRNLFSVLGIKEIEEM
ncbi:MAG: arginine--tRNA ligase [Candidatus Aenigmatarchaeota archaeon]